eukprot:SAG22_NODE_4688_length_1192_cov_1.446478_2_plen_85_part_00
MKVATIPTSLVPMKPGLLAKCKSTNYMLNSLNHLEVWVGDDGLVKEVHISHGPYCHLLTLPLHSYSTLLLEWRGLQQTNSIAPA